MAPAGLKGSTAKNADVNKNNINAYQSINIKKKPNILN